MAKERFDKIISNQFNISRKDARTAIRRGKGMVGGVVIKDPSILVETSENIVFDGKKLEYKKYVYILMNKPKGVLSASDDKRQKTVVDLVPDEYKRTGLFPVGRLDKDTTGLLIITDDGEFAHKVISPNKNVDKTYMVTLDGTVTDEMVKLFSNGVVLADGTVCKSAKLEPCGDNKALITITEGKYHQIKRMFGVVGLGVNELERKTIGGLSLPENLMVGECRLLSAKEISLIFSKC